MSFSAEGKVLSVLARKEVPLTKQQPFSLSATKLPPTSTSRYGEKKIVPFKTPSLGPGEMAQQGRAFAALAEDLSWVPNLTTVSHSSCGGANSSPDL